MATVQLSDIIDLEVFQDLPSQMDPEKSRFVQSGIITRAALFDELANAAGRTAEMPFWNDIDPTSEPNLSNDNPASTATPEKINQGEQTTRKAFLNKGWSAADLASEVASGGNAIQQIRNRSDSYWTRQFQRRVIATANGVLADNVANDGSDMVHDVAGATNADIATGTLFSRSNFTSAVYTMGDSAESLGVIAVHSVVMKRMVDNNDIDYVKDSDGNIVERRYMGHTVVVDDSMPFTPAAGGGAGDAAPRYTSVIFGAGAMGWGEGDPNMPVELQRGANQANGAGVETLWTRKTWIIHPLGFQNTGTPAAVSFSNTELAAATTWNRVIDRKNVPMAYLTTNG